MKYLYVLSSTAADTYYEQFLLSATSLRMKMPNVYIALLTDDKTAKTLTGKRSAFRDLINEIKVVKIPQDKNMHYRSRFLKTTMRQHITGDFLYIDCDTIVCRDLSEIEKTQADIAAVLDFHTTADEFEQRIYQWYENIYKKLKFESYTKLNKLFNGGLMYVRDTEFTHRFFEK
ncbi:MAG: hypothetical protein LBB53_06545, partial [Prevotellaceae bacterium]|nr:hypothetical protein [Prevotellaceae bacterium]